MSEPLLFPSKVRQIQPQAISRPCDFGLKLTVIDLETQLGTIEAYNRLVLATLRLKRKIDVGQVLEPVAGAAEKVR